MGDGDEPLNLLHVDSISMKEEMEKNANPQWMIRMQGVIMSK